MATPGVRAHGPGPPCTLTVARLLALEEHGWAGPLLLALGALVFGSPGPIRSRVLTLDAQDQGPHRPQVCARLWPTQGPGAAGPERLFTRLASCPASEEDAPPAPRHRGLQAPSFSELSNDAVSPVPSTPGTRSEVLGSGQERPALNTDEWGRGYSSVGRALATQSPPQTSRGRPGGLSSCQRPRGQPRHRAIRGLETWQPLHLPILRASLLLPTAPSGGEARAG